MRWQAAAETDLPECLALEPCNLGEGIVGPKVARHIWRDLTLNLSFNSGVFMDADPGGLERILGFGACVFVKPEFANRELAEPRPNMNSRIFASIASGKSVVLPSSELYSPRSEDGLDVAILFGNYHTDMNQEQLREVQMLLPYGFAEVLRGYRLNRILNETVGEVQRAFVQSSGVWRVVQSFANERVLHILTRQTAFTASGSIAQSLFHYEQPTLRLRDTDKHLLSQALDGGSDSELAARLHLSVPSVKKRWQSLFERVTVARPGLLPISEDRLSSDARGPQKRHHILAYVRSHPGELRPYRFHP